MKRELAAYWHRMQDHFYRSYREDHAGWGQFLGESAVTPQIGIHGTSAGAIVLAINESTQTRPARDVRAHLERLLKPADERGEDKIRQNPRFINAFLGYTLLSKSANSERVKSLREEAYRRRISGMALWGDYWANENDQSSEISIFCSSLFLIALALTGEENLEESGRRAATELERYFFSDPVRHAAHRRIVICALALSFPGEFPARLRDAMKDLALAPTDIRHKDVYFYDYRSKDGVQKRDYFIVPDEAFLCLACMSRRVPARLRLKGHDIVENLTRQLDGNNDVYVSNPSDSPSTVDQAFVVLSLWGFHKSQSNGCRIRFADRAIYALLKHRDELERPGCYLIVIAYVLMAGHFLNEVMYGVEDFDRSTAWLVGTAFILGALRRPSYVWRVVTRRSR